ATDILSIQAFLHVGSTSDDKDITTKILAENSCGQGCNNLKIIIYALGVMVLYRKSYGCKKEPSPFFKTSKVQIICP
ncbi:MAG: hypothetical protein ACK53Y_12775, partial [bacterium]